MNKDIVKAVRKVSAFNNNSLGTVLVEFSNEHARTSVMKSKHCLENHASPALRKLKISNAKSQERIYTENCTYGLLKLNYGDKYYIAGNGMIREKSNRNFQSSSRVHNAVINSHNSSVAGNNTTSVAGNNIQSQHSQLIVNSNERFDSQQRPTVSFPPGAFQERPPYLHP